MNTSRASAPARRPAKTVLNALTTDAPGAASAICSAAEAPTGVTSPSNVVKSTGLQMSTRIFPSSRAAHSRATSRLPR